MAIYRIKVEKNGNVRIQARYQPFKGGPWDVRDFMAGPETVGEAALSAAEWANSRRPPTKNNPGRASKGGGGGSQ